MANNSKEALKAQLLAVKEREKLLRAKIKEKVASDEARRKSAMRKARTRYLILLGTIMDHRIRSNKDTRDFAIKELDKLPREYDRKAIAPIVDELKTLK